MWSEVKWRRKQGQRWKKLYIKCETAPYKPGDCWNNLFFHSMFFSFHFMFQLKPVWVEVQPCTCLLLWYTLNSPSLSNSVFFLQFSPPKQPLKNILLSLFYHSLYNSGFMFPCAEREKASKCEPSSKFSSKTCF